MFFHQHLGSPLRRPRTGKALRAVGNPESGEAHDGGVAGEQVRLYFVKGIHGGVVREFVFRRILAHVDAGQPSKNEWPCVGAEDSPVVDFDLAKGLYGVGKFCDLPWSMKRPSN